MTEIAHTLVMVPIASIKPYQRNPRKNSTTIDKLVELIPRVGFNVPLVLDRHNVIVKGHSRWTAAIRLGMKAVPCVYSDADPEAIKLDRLADNRVQEFSQWDDALLSSELAEFKAGYDFGLFDLYLPTAADPPAPPPAPAPLEVVCNHCGHRLNIPQ